jgi:hypothetical protein
MRETEESLRKLLNDYCDLRDAYIHHVGTGCACQYCKLVTAEWMRRKPPKKPRQSTLVKEKP